jgi:hypothetical protein
MGVIPDKFILLGKNDAEVIYYLQTRKWAGQKHNQILDLSESAL